MKMYRDFGVNMIIKNYVVVDVEQSADSAVVRFQFNSLPQGYGIVETLRKTAEDMQKELDEWSQAEKEGKIL